MDPTAILLFYVVLLVSLVFHEAAHALFALFGGDRTAYLGGQVSLNPIPHIRREPFGTVILPLAVLFMSEGTMCFGYASTPIDPVWAYRHPKRAALMSAAGPLANACLAAIALLILKLLIVSGNAEPVFRLYLDQLATPADKSTSGAMYAVCRILSVFVGLNVLLCLFNLYPLPPLDGAGVVEGLAPKTQGFFGFLRSQPFLAIAGLLVVWSTLPSIFWPTLGFLQNLL